MRVIENRHANNVKRYFLLHEKRVIESWKARSFLHTGWRRNEAKSAGNIEENAL